MITREITKEEIQHPYKKGEKRIRYRVPITKFIVIEADPSMPIDDVIKEMIRAHDNDVNFRKSVYGKSMHGSYSCEVYTSDDKLTITTQEHPK